MRENCTSGSVAGAPGNRSPYAGGHFLSSYDVYRNATMRDLTPLPPILHIRIAVFLPSVLLKSLSAIHSLRRSLASHVLPRTP